MIGLPFAAAAVLAAASPSDTVLTAGVAVGAVLPPSDGPRTLVAPRLSLVGCGREAGWYGELSAALLVLNGSERAPAFEAAYGWRWPAGPVEFLAAGGLTVVPGTGGPTLKAGLRLPTDSGFEAFLLGTSALLPGPLGDGLYTLVGGEARLGFRF